MAPNISRHREPLFLHPPRARSGRSSRRSSASGRSNFHSQPSDHSILLTPTSQTSDDIHQLAFGDSNTTAIHDLNSNYQWGIADAASTAGADLSYSVDNQGLFISNLDSAVPSPIPHPDDDILNPNMPLNDSESRLQFIIQAIRNNYANYQNKEAYVSYLARLILDNQTLSRYQLLTQQNLNTGPEPRAPPNPPTRNTSYRCLLCIQSLVFQDTAFGRHVNEQHQTKSFFYCIHCEFKNTRRHRLEEHLLRAHSRRSTRQQISRCEVLEPVPLVCDICFAQGLQQHPGPFQSWKSWFEGIRSHCRIQETPSPTGPPESFPDNDGDGAGGYGGATGHGSASHGAGPSGVSSSTGSGWAMGAPWSGVFPYGLTSSRSAAPIDTLADRPNCSDIKPTQDATSSDLNTDVDRDHRSRQLFRDRNISQHGYHDKDTGVTKGRCGRCKHEYDSCPACPQKYTPGYCHLCNGPTTAVGAHHKNQPCDSTQIEAPLANLVHGLSGLSLERQKTVSRSDVPKKQAISSLSKSAFRKNIVSAAQPWSSVTIRLIPSAVNEFNPMYCLVISISRLSLESSYMPQLMRMDDCLKITVDALMTGQKMLKNIHKNPPGSSEKLVKQISRCHTALDAIRSEMYAPSQYNSAQKARQKRLSSLRARLRAVTFVLALQKAVITDEVKEEPPSDDDSQLTLLDAIGKKIHPLTELGSLYQLVYKHLCGDFWTSSGLLEVLDQNTKKLAVEDSSGVCTFLRALVTSISDPQQSYLKEYAASEFSAFIEDIF